MSAPEHYLVVDDRGYCGGCDVCGTVEETAYCACGGAEDCPGIDEAANLLDLGQLIESLTDLTGQP